MAQTKSARSLFVVAGIIRLKTKDGEKILIAKRLPDAKVEAGKWEFPGGKIEPFEAAEDALIREIKEELNLKIKVDEIYDVNSHVYERAGKKTHIILICYLCSYKSGKLKLIEAADAKWVSQEEFGDYDFAAADHRFLKSLAREERAKKS